MNASAPSAIGSRCQGPAICRSGCLGLLCWARSVAGSHACVPVWFGNSFCASRWPRASLAAGLALDRSENRWEQRPAFRACPPEKLRPLLSIKDMRGVSTWKWPIRFHTLLITAGLGIAHMATDAYIPLGIEPDDQCELWRPCRRKNQCQTVPPADQMGFKDL